MSEKSKLSEIQKLAIIKIAEGWKKEINQKQFEEKAFNLDDVISFGLKGSLKVGKSYEQTCDPAIPWETIALVSLSHLNETTQDHVIGFALKGESFEEIPLEEIKAKVKSKTVALKEKAKKNYKGKLTGKLVVVE